MFKHKIDFVDFYGKMIPQIKYKVKMLYMCEHEHTYAKINYIVV